MKTKNIMVTFFLLCISIVTFGQMDSTALYNIAQTALNIAAAAAPKDVVQNVPNAYLSAAIMGLFSFLFGWLHRKKTLKNYTHNSEVAKAKADYEKQIEELK